MTNPICRPLLLGLLEFLVLLGFLLMLALLRYLAAPLLALLLSLLAFRRTLGQNQRFRR